MDEFDSGAFVAWLHRRLHFFVRRRQIRCCEAPHAVFSAPHDIFSLRGCRVAAWFASSGGLVSSQASGLVGVWSCFSSPLLPVGVQLLFYGNGLVVLCSSSGAGKLQLSFPPRLPLVFTLCVFSPARSK
ncbi:unnamed protein product [Arabidopsis lyrata]|nr:unnamed protein product [Arabidopsis lyrata]